VEVSVEIVYLLKMQSQHVKGNLSRVVVLWKVVEGIKLLEHVKILLMGSILLVDQVIEVVVEDLLRNSSNTNLINYKTLLTQCCQ
jgi:hypothetical protein